MKGHSPFQPVSHSRAGGGAERPQCGMQRGGSPVSKGALGSRFCGNAARLLRTVGRGKGDRPPTMRTNDGLFCAVPCGILHIQHYPGKAYFPRLVPAGDFFFRKRSKKRALGARACRAGPIRVVRACRAKRRMLCPHGFHPPRAAGAPCAPAHRANPSDAGPCPAHARILGGNTLGCTAPEHPLLESGAAAQAFRGITGNNRG